MTQKELKNEYKDVPEIVNSPIEMKEANEPIHIYDGVIELRLRDTKIKLTGEILFGWFPSPGVRFSGTVKNSTTDLMKSIKSHEKFDLIIGNPPFIRGAIKQYSKYWYIGNQKVKIPQGQIALKFLSESLPYLKNKGLLCLIVKSSGLLYNSTSEEFKKTLFSNFNAIQILAFTALARNKSLWDNSADVATAAIFIKNEKPDINQNILHLTFRRTKATKERIIFEIDDYDLHFVDRKTAIENPFVWKNNLLGGGRIRLLIEKTQKIKSFKFTAMLSINLAIINFSSSFASQYTISLPE